MIRPTTTTVGFWLVILVGAGTTLTGVGCSGDLKLKGHDYGPIATLDSCTSYQFEIVSLPYGELPNTGYGASAAYDTSFRRDDDGVMVSEIDGQVSYHPVNMAHQLFRLLDVYSRTGDTALLALATRYMERLAEMAMPFDSAIYFLYNFDYKVHQRDDAELTAPWFSGMAQGELLEVYVRMFAATSDSTYLEMAGGVFNSFLRRKGEAEPWTVFVDSIGCFWVEEYPLDEPSMTLNGFIFAVFGLYQFHQLTHDPRAETVLVKCLSTIKNYLPLFRRIGRPSFYNLRFRRFDEEYHLIHIIQLKYLAKMSGDPFFAAMADSLRADYQRPPIGG